MILLSCDAAIEMADGSETGLMLRGLLCPNEMVVASDALQTQVAQRLAELVKQSRFNEKRAQKILWCVGELTERHIPARKYAAEALNLALERDVPATDALEVLMAKRLPATLFTLDARLQAACNELGVVCTHNATL